MKNRTPRNILALTVVFGALLLNACLNPITGDYEIPPLAVTINPATEAVLVFKNTSPSEKITNVWLTPSDPAAQPQNYESRIGPNSSYAVTETGLDGKVVPKRFAAGNLNFRVEGSTQEYTIAAFGVTYVTLSETAVDTGAGPTTIINVDVVNPHEPFSVRLLDNGNLNIQLDSEQYDTIEKYLSQKLIAPILVSNKTTFTDPVIFEIKNVDYGTTKVEVPRGQSRTITLSNFNQADANHTVSALANGKTASTYVNVWRGSERDDARHVNFVELTDEDFYAPYYADYSITSNGGGSLNMSGLGVPHDPSQFDTTILYFTFDTDLDFTPTPVKEPEAAGGQATFHPLQPTGNPRVFTLAVDTLVVALKEVIGFTITDPRINPAVRRAEVFKTMTYEITGNESQNTTALTVTLSSRYYLDPPTVQVVSGNAGFGGLERAGDYAVYTLPVTSLVTAPSETVTLRITNEGFDQADHQVTVYKN